MELVALFDVSESTIRRDIDTLHNKRLISKVFGGATVVKETQTVENITVAQKRSMNKSAKHEIAKYSAGIIADYDYVFLDAGTTTELIIDYLATDSKAQFVTNSPNNATKLVHKGLSTYMIGGVCKRFTEAIVGGEAVSAISKFAFTKAFVGANGIDVSFGISTLEPEEAAVKREIVRRGLNSFVVADSSKFDMITPVAFSNGDDVAIITEKMIARYSRRYEIVVVG